MQRSQVIDSAANRPTGRWYSTTPSIRSCECTLSSQHSRDAHAAATRAKAQHRAAAFHVAAQGVALNLALNGDRDVRVDAATRGACVDRHPGAWIDLGTHRTA